MAFPKGSNFFNWKKIIVRSSHLILTLYITVSLLIKETGTKLASLLILFIAYKSN